jgi:predicted nucleic acid-binding protein
VTVYVESNFIVRLAFRQEEHESCEQLLDQAKGGAIRLVVPAFSLTEPFRVLRGRIQELKRVYEGVGGQVRALRRSAPHADPALRLLEPLAEALERIGAEEEERLYGVLDRVSDAAGVMDLTSEVLAAARGGEREWGLSSQDAIVYASVLAHLDSGLAEGESCFVTTDADDFKQPHLRRALEERGCKPLFKFSDALGYATRRREP